MNSLNLFGVRKNYLISGRSPLLHQFTRRAIKLTVVIIVEYHCYQLHTNFIEYPSIKVKYIYNVTCIARQRRDKHLTQQ
jgi:hypothetical protein